MEHACSLVAANLGDIAASSMGDSGRTGNDGCAIDNAGVDDETTERLQGIQARKTLPNQKAPSRSGSNVATGDPEGSVGAAGPGGGQDSTCGICAVIPASGSNDGNMHHFCCGALSSAGPHKGEKLCMVVGCGHWHCDQRSATVEVGEWYRAHDELHCDAVAPG